MNLFFGSNLTRALGICEQKMKELVKYFEFKEDKNAFLDACKNYDSNAVNNILDKVFCGLLNATDLITGFEMFSEKFPELSIDTTNIYFEKEFIMKYAEYSDEMLRIIEKNLKQGE